MNFDRIAPHYGWLEMVVFGNQLQRARLAFVREIPPPRRVLIVGEGNGRFLAEFVRAHPGAVIDCMEASGRMIGLARRRGEFAQVRFVQADVREVALPAAHYDLIVTHFVLDCFDEEALPALVTQLGQSAAPNARWLVADFFTSEGGWRKLRAQFLIAFMYRFFRLVAGIEGRYLPDYPSLLDSGGFRLEQAFLFPNEMIRSQLWRRIHRPG